MKTLVIHPKDYTTDFLYEIYKDKDWTAINSNVSKKYLKEQIKWHDRIVMLGHGTEHGLIGTYSKRKRIRYFIDSTWVYLLREKICVCIWCNADVFFLKYGLKGFYTGMIVSESEEALLYCERPYTDEDINQSNKLFAASLRQAIDLDNMLQEMKTNYVGENKIILFNREKLFSTFNK